MIKTRELTETDVLTVANSLNITLNEEQIKQVIELYPSEAEQDPTGTWDLITEHCIYTVINQ